jgi:uncharacterized membrane protein YfhO
MLQAFNRWGYYPLILIGSWAFATVNRLYDFADPGHKIFWLSFLDIGFAGLMVSLLMLLHSILDVVRYHYVNLGNFLEILNLLTCSGHNL